MILMVTKPFLNSNLKKQNRKEKEGKGKGIKAKGSKRGEER
jgi:hypothetical protein